MDSLPLIAAFVGIVIVVLAGFAFYDSWKRKKPVRATDTTLIHRPPLGESMAMYAVTGLILGGIGFGLFFTGIFAVIGIPLFIAGAFAILFSPFFRYFRWTGNCPACAKPVEFWNGRTAVECKQCKTMLLLKNQHLIKK